MNRAERIAACVLRHTTAVGGWFPGDVETLEVILCSNGTAQLKAVCAKCGNRSGAIPERLWPDWRIYCAGPVSVRANPEYEREECCVRGCSSRDTEYHHFAPYNTFGIDADNWPCLPVCRTHHREWHGRMDGYCWNTPRGDVA